MNAEQIKQEQERVSALLKGVTPGKWEYYINENTDEGDVTYERDDVTYTVGRAYRPENTRLMAEAPRLARAYLTALDTIAAQQAQLAQAAEREKVLRENALKAIDAAIQCENDVLDVYQRRASLTTLDLAVADMKQDSLPKLKAARTALAQAEKA